MERTLRTVSYEEVETKVARERNVVERVEVIHVSLGTADSSSPYVLTFLVLVPPLYPSRRVGFRALAQGNKCLATSSGVSLGTVCYL